MVLTPPLEVTELQQQRGWLTCTNNSVNVPEASRSQSPDCYYHKRFKEVFKQVWPTDQAAAVAAHPQSRLFVSDKRTKLIDTGAAISVFPRPRNFKSKAILTVLLGIDKKITTVYNPQANGCTERCHLSMKAHLDMDHWTLPIILIDLCSTFSEDIGASVAESTRVASFSDYLGNYFRNLLHVQNLA
ncbi:unnamed protein product [Nezara viridula]|uniref:Uncharacterized protein n=1 Tax=Nezara viridula TaxID=85310 RepID=A0A9P0H696_NEZVI|nr:unnamed protein product [Nezara viridula]